MEFLIGIIVSALVVYFFWEKGGMGALSANGAPADGRQFFVADKASQGRASFVAPASAGAPCHSIPQDSVLRRHYLTHVRHMIEAVTFPQPSDSVLRRHYEQLIESELEKCLASDAAMEKLVGLYEAAKA